MRTTIFVFILIVLLSCTEHFDEKELIGYYTPTDYKNNFDTLQLKQNGTYKRKLYDINKKKLLDLNGKWKLKNNHTLVLESFYLNLDDDLEKFPNKIFDTTSGMTTFFETNNGRIQFCVGYYYDGKNCYHKIK